MSFSWSAATGAISYNLYRATTSGGEGSTPYRTGLAGTTFTDTGLTNGTTCYYQVTAVNSGGQSGKSSEVSAVPKAAAPAAPATPTNLTATPGNAQVSFSWSAATGAISYNLYRATTSGGEGSTPYRTGLTGTTFTDTGLTNGTTCYYQVTAVNSGGQSGKSSEVSAVPQAAASFSLWSSTAAPYVASDPDTSAVELGVKFTSDKAGSITGIRFYKGSGNGGTHVGHLWTASGTLLATATFTGETASGWQQVNFATPVAIAANTTYVASYDAPAGHYADDTGSFASGYNSGPLHVPADGGVYAYGTGGGFPTQVWQSSNYWVDVVLSTGTSPTAAVSASPMTATTSAISGSSPTVGSSTATGSTPSQPNGVYLSPGAVDQVLASPSSTPSAHRRRHKRA